MNTRRLLFRLLALVATAIGGGVVYDVSTSPGAGSEARQEVPAELLASEPAAAKAGRKRCVFASFRDGEWVTGWGTVKKLLPDDTYAPCHQRFLLVDPTGETLLVAHNIDKWPRLSDVRPGDIVEFKGEFKDTDRGYLVHWTHPDPAGRKPGGYIRKGAK